MAETLTIDALGAGGDGVVETGGERLFVPYTLRGETVEAEPAGNRARLLRVLTPSPDRIAPACRHFGTCGGCALQHMAEAPYLAWKRSVVERSFALHGIAAPVEPVVAGAPGSRRRAVFSAVRTASGVAVGFNRRGSEEIVAIDECPVLASGLARRLPLFRDIAARAFRSKRRGRMAVVLADNGLDIAVEGAGRPDRDALAALGGFGTDVSIARLTLDGTTVFLNRRPELSAGTVTLFPIPGGFVQASRFAEDAMAAVALDHVGNAGPIADLFAGIGTFTVRLAARAAVTAVEGDAALLAGLDAALRAARGLKPVAARRRDLFANPLAPVELNAFAAVLFDPPAAGAKAQSEALAASKVPRVVAVSCNPATLARDARILVDGGYRLERVVPVDQFHWSPEIEVVATFAR